VTEDTVYILLWMLIVFILGFIIGRALGEELSRRRCAEEKVEDLRDQLIHAEAPALDRRLRQMHGTLNDAHKLILAVSKGLQKQPR
jgi:signal transduction histidine kinase